MPDRQDGAEVIVVVDDDDAVRRSLKFALELEGLRVRLYEGAEALLAAEDLPEEGCLVLDYYMPGMTGAELLERLRSRRVKLPAILITAKVTQEVRRRAVRAGFHKLLEKPLDDGGLVESIRAVLPQAGDTPAHSG